MVVVGSVQMMQVQVQVPRMVRLAMVTLLSVPLLPPVLILAPTQLLRMAPLSTFV